MLTGTLPNLQYKIITHGIPRHSHHTNLLLGLLDGGISIQGISFLNNLLINRNHTLLNILNILNTLVSSRRTNFPLMYRYNLNCLLNLILTQTIKYSINLRLSTCPPTPFLLCLVMIFVYGQGK